MIVNSIAFLLFFVLVFAAYFMVPQTHRWMQNLVLLTASYSFYGYTDLRTLPILIGLTLLFYGLGYLIQRASDDRTKTWLMRLGVVAGLGVLFYFKYLNFFVDSFTHVLRGLGIEGQSHHLQVILPLGLSFFIFRLLSYLIEIQRGKLLAESNLLIFANYVAFFPSLLSGPIDRPGAFLPQLQKARAFDTTLATDGMRQILWGMFKKMVIANNLSMFVDGIWSQSAGAGTPAIWLAVLLYPIQMYADFSGYSDMSIGVAKLLGIRIAINFNYPFFAVNIAEYWRRWHISLTSWLTDYVFSPLSIRFRDWGNRGLIVSILITFVLIGAWHGARWTFVVFGLYHGLLYIPLMLNGSFFKKSKLKSQGRWNLPAGKDFRQMTGTFLLVALGLILFRAESLNDFAHMLLRILDVRLSALQQFPSLQLISALIPAFPAVCFMFWIEWRKRQKEFALQLEDSAAWKRRLLYAALVVCIFVFRGEAGEFIYFQF